MSDETTEPPAGGHLQPVPEPSGLAALAGQHDDEPPFDGAGVDVSDIGADGDFYDPTDPAGDIDDDDPATFEAAVDRGDTQRIPGPPPAPVVSQEMMFPMGSLDGDPSVTLDTFGPDHVERLCYVKMSNAQVPNSSGGLFKDGEKIPLIVTVRAHAVKRVLKYDSETDEVTERKDVQDLKVLHVKKAADHLEDVRNDARAEARRELLAQLGMTEQDVAERLAGATG